MSMSELQKLLDEIDELTAKVLAKKSELEQLKKRCESNFATCVVDLTIDYLKARSMPEPPKTVPWPVHSPATKPRPTIYKYSCGQPKECRFGLEGKDKVTINFCHDRFHCPYLKIVECKSVKLDKLEN